MKGIKFCIFCLVIGLVLSIRTASAQTSAFTYQGSLKNGGNPANGTFDFEVSLFDGLTGGSELFSNIVPGVVVTNGMFSLSLNFGSATFPGANRFLEIRVRPAGGGAFTVLSPRQLIGSSPYSIKSLLSETTNNALSLGGIAANQYLTTTSGGTNFIQNQQAAAQTTSNFWISGAGSANIFNAGTQYNIGGNRVLGMGQGDSIFAGIGAGVANTSGYNNSFFWTNAGRFNTIGFHNSFFGLAAGFSNTTGSGNSFFGLAAGQTNTEGSSNSFFGQSAGFSNTEGIEDSFIGRNAGFSNLTGAKNSFFGRNAGAANTTGSENTVIGYSANVGFNNLTNATAIGANTIVAQSNSLVLGNNANVGIGTSLPSHQLTVGAPDTPIVPSARVGVYGAGATYSIVRDTLHDVEGLFGAEIAGVLYGSMTNHQVSLRTNNANRMTIAPTGEVAILTLGSAGALSLCSNASSQISTCSSSLRYKTNINPFGSGLDLISRLRPVSFNWLADNQFDFGLVAEEVAEIEPLLVSYNANGEVEGVKYDRVAVVAVNAIKEQQSQIDALTKRVNEQKEENRRLQAQIDQLKRLFCRAEPDAEICKFKN